MPRGDGTGPGGMGPMTGRAAGYCAGYSVPGYMNPVPGRGAWAAPVNPGYAPAPYAASPSYYGPGAPGMGLAWNRGVAGRAYGGFGQGFGRGFGRGRGRGRWW